MSTGVSDQRMRGQGSQANGPKEQLNDHEEFSSWRNQSLQQNYVAPGNDPYLSSYYGTSFPYQLDGAWSSNSVPGAGGAAEGGVAFLGGYGVQGGAGHHQDSYGIDGMFGSNGGFGNFGQPGFSGGYGLQGNGTTAAEYSTWERKAHYDDYYQPRGPDHHSVYQSSRMEEPPSVKQVEQGMQGLALEQTRESSTKSTLPESAPVSSSGGGGGSSSQPKKLTWASIASQPAKPQLTTKKKSMVPPPMVTPRTPSLDIGTWENKNGGGSSQQTTMAPPTISMAPPPIPQAAPTQQQAPVPQPTAPKPMPPAATPHRPPVVYQNAAARPPPTAQRSANPAGSTPAYPPPSGAPPTSVPPPPSMMNAPPPPPSSSMVPAVSPSAGVLSSSPSNPVLEELQSKHIYNPKEFDLTAKNARFFVIKSYSEDDIHRSIKYEIWCSTEHGNKRLDSAFRERDGKGAVYLYFSVNGSGHFCGMAEMTSPVDMSSSLSVWSQDKWRGQFTVKWIYVKDVPNSALRHIRLENNENKPVTNSRDTQEVPVDKGRQVLKIIHTFRHATSIFDDFTHYEKRQAEEDQRKSVVVSPHESHYDGHGGGSQQPRPDRGDRDRDPRDRERDHRDRERDHRDFGRGDRDRDMYRHERDHRDIRDGGGGGRGGGGRSGGGGNGYDFRERDAYRERDNRNHRDGFRDRDRERDRDRDSFPPHRGPGGGGRSGHRDNGRMRH